MTGEVDNSGRALIVLRLRPSLGADATPVAVWVDTAFTGELVIPRGTVETLGLRQSAAVLAGLADGTRVVLETYTCLIEWFGQERSVEVVVSEGQFPLLGVGLLKNRRLEIDYRSRTLSID
jgi:clan AA aspartic protease